MSYERKRKKRLMRMAEERNIHTIEGTDRYCKNWQIEGILRMLCNVLDPEVAMDQDRLVVYGGTGQAARSWDSLEAIFNTLPEMDEDQTLLIQSGRPVGVFETTKQAPRMLMANSLLVPKWATWDHFWELEQKGLIMYGQMTAGSWNYIGHQGILQGTFGTYARAAKKHFQSDLRGKFLLSAGVGEMGSAQPLACTMNNGAGLFVDIDKQQIEKVKDHGYLDIIASDLDEGLEIVQKHKEQGTPISVGVHANAATVYNELLEKGIIPDMVTDQTAAHDLVQGYYPEGYTLEEADELRKRNPEKYKREAEQTIVKHVKAMVKFKKCGAVVFEYGNGMREQAKEAGFDGAFAFKGFVKKYIRPMFLEGRGPFRWTALTGNPEDIKKTDDVILDMFPENDMLVRWIHKAREFVPWQGLPARVCWLGYEERARFGKKINEMVRNGELSGPIWIGRDHLDTGSVASPTRETEGMKDGSDAIADWPILNALLNAISGATWVSVHHGGGVGMGLSIHAGMSLVCDGTERMGKRIERVLTADPWSGIVRHADAGYEQARQTVEEKGLWMPYLQHQKQKEEEKGS